MHNLHAYAWGRHAPEPYDWAISFETRVRELLLAGEYKPLVNYEDQLGSEAELAAPTPDHYVPRCFTWPALAYNPSRSHFRLRA